MGTRYGKRIVTDGLVLCLDAADNISAPHNDLPVKQGCLMWLDGADDSVFTYSSGTLVSEWRDKSGNNNHVSNSNSARHPSRNVTINSKSAVDFSSDSLVANNVFASTATSYTKIAVVYQTARTDSGNVISSSSGHAFFFGGDTSIKLYHGGTFVTSSVALADNTAGIISGTVQYNSSSSASGEVFVNGTSGGTGTTSNASISSTQVQIGSHNNANYFNGYIAEALVYDRVLSSDELTKVHNYLQNKWNIEVSDAKWYDRTANNNTFTIANGSTYLETNKGYFELDGTNEYFLMTGATQLASLTTNFTVEALVRLDVSGGQYGIFSKGASFGNGWTLYARQGPQFSFIGYDSNGTTSGIFATPSGGISTGTWYHVAYTYDQSYIKGYINGSEEVSSSYTQTFANTNSTCYVGYNGSIGSPNFWNGSIAFVRVYNKALSAAEILQNYNATKGRYTALGTASNPAESAAQILASDSTSANGLYWIKPSGYSGSAQLIYCDMSRGGWMLVASNDASDTTIPGGTSRNSLSYALNRNGTNGALGTPDPNKDYIIGNMIDSLSFSSVKVIGWGRGSTNGTYFWDGDQNNLGSSIIAEWNLSSSGSSRRTEVVARANVTLSGSTTLHSSASYFVLDAVACDSGLNANSNQSTVGGAGVANSSGDPSNGTYLGHGSSEGSYEGWYISGGSQADSQGYTTWVK